MYFLRFSILSALLFFVSCDDGDIVVSQFDFNIDDDIKFCYSGEEDDQTVFYNVNESNNEVIFLVLDGEFDFEEEFNSDDDNVSDKIDLNNNVVTYLKFNSFSDNDAEEYFCTAVTNNNKTIVRELNGEGGTLNIITKNTIDDDGDEDNDGLKNEQEVYYDGFAKIDGLSIHELDEVDLLDSDKDGIPNFRDDDDDNDNVPTSKELYIKDDEGNENKTDENNDGIPDAGYLDTDGDGNLDYLDTDDDGDGVITLMEFDPNDSSLSPETNVNNGNVPFYLIFSEDPETGVLTEDDIITISNSYSTNFETIVKTANLTLSGNSEGTVTRDNLVIGEINETSSISQTVSISIVDEVLTFTTTINDDDGNAENDTVVESGTVVNVPNDEETEEVTTETP